MGFFKKLAKGVIDTALVPVEMVKDVATLGGVITDEPNTYTGRRFKKIAEDLEGAYDSLDE